MRKWNRVIAIILAVVIALSNLPPVQLSAAAAEDGSTGMRLRQTGFDETTGILTMTLEIKPSVLGKVIPGANRNTYQGHFIDEAYLAFQVDTLSVEPITTDGTVIDAGYGRIGFVGMKRSQIDSGDPELLKAWQTFVSSEGMGEQFGQGFNASMGTQVFNGEGYSDTFIEDYSGYFTSYNRQASGLMDCYLHLRWSPSWKDFEEVTDLVDVNGEPLESGYVKAIDLKFQCYSGDIGEDGHSAKATSTDALFCNSIRLPSGVKTDSPAASSGMTKEQMQELIDQFYAAKKESVGMEGLEEQLYFSTGVAGFRERATNAYGNFTDAWHYYAYDVQPRYTKFNEQQIDNNCAAMTGDPLLSYENMDKQFIVLEFEASLENTYEFGETDTKTADFYISSDKGQYPRYSIPYVAEMDDLEAAEALQHIWKPKEPFRDESYVALKYYLSTRVSASSTTKPEELEGGMDAFLKQLSWKFGLRENDGEDPIPLDTYYQNGSLSYADPLDLTAAETQPTTVTMKSDYIDRTFEVRTAFISDSNSNYYGTKVQTVQETTEGLYNIDKEVHVTPLGVMFDFTDQTQVSYLTSKKNQDGQGVKSEAAPGYAPQLRISSQAADARSYLWLGTLGGAGGVAARRGEVYILVTYTDTAGGSYSSTDPIQVKLYKDEERVPAYTEISFDAEYRDPDQSEDETAYLIDVATHNPELSWAGIKINAALYDQYGDDMYDEKGVLRVPDIQIKPTAETQKVIDEHNQKEENKNLQWVNALDTRLDEDTRVYYLIYGNGRLYGPNDLVAGKYEISATADGVADPAKCTLTVTKAPNKFSYMDSEVRLSSETISTPQGLLYGTREMQENGERIQEIRLRVPPKVLGTGSEFISQSVTAEFNLLEIANQWRDPNSNIQVGGPAYDVLEGLRDEDGNLDPAKLRAAFEFEYAWSNADGSSTAITGVDTTTTDFARTGRFTYDSTAGSGTYPDSMGGAGEGSPMYVTVKATRVDGEPDEVQTNKYRIYFVRDTRSLTTIKGRFGGSVPGQEVTANLSVPEEGKTEKTQIEFLPFDQYDEPLNWGSLQATDGQQWQMVIDRTSMKDSSGKTVSSLPGVSLADPNSSYVQLTSEAEPCSFDVYAIYGGKDTSRPASNNQLAQFVHVVVTKKPSVPARVQSITEGIIEIDVPNMDAVEAAENKVAVNSGGPKIVVVDQYGDQMYRDDEDPKNEYPGRHYAARWSFEQMPPDPRITLNTATGVVSVESNAEKGCAPAWNNIVMTVRLYSKVESPAGSGRYVQGEWMSGITINTTYTGLRVVRNATPNVTELEITNEGLKYPAQDESRVAALEGDVTTEYGAKTELVAGDGSIWLLESVEYADGTKAMYREPVLDESGQQQKDENDLPMWRYFNPPQIEYAASSRSYTDASRRVITLEQNAAQLRFGNTITDIDWAPVAVKVTVEYSNETNSKTLPVLYDGKEFSQMTRKPGSITIAERLREVIQVPKSTEPDVRLELDAVVKDQFGFIINGEGASNVVCDWEIVDPQDGVSINKNDMTLVVNSHAGNGSVTLRASYTLNGTTVSVEQPIGLGLAPSEPTVLTPLGIEELPEITDMTRAQIPMPGFTGPSRSETGRALNNAKQSTYTLKSKVEDGNHVHLTAQTVKWEITSDDYGIASISNNNKLTIQCTQAWIDAGRPADVRIGLHAYDSSAPHVSADVTVTVQKQDNFGAYAMPALVEEDGWPVYTDNDSLPAKTYLLVPSMEKYRANGEKPYEAHFKAQVYSQYREEMTTWPVEIAYRNPITMSSEVTGLEMQYNQNAGTGVLYISPNVDNNVTHLLVVARPFGDNGTLDTAINKCDIYFDAGASYQAGVALGTDFFKQPGPVRNEDVPTWNPGDDPNIPGLNEEFYAAFEIKAFVHDQRGSDYDGYHVDGVYPVWKIIGEMPEGVTLDNPTDDYSQSNVYDADNNPYGKTLRVWVSNRAVSGTFDVQVWANGHLGEGGDFEKTQKINLVKAPSTPKYIYFRDVLSTDETDGVGLGEGITRPGIADPGVTVSVGTMVFDAYGFEMNNVATNIAIRQATLPEGVTVEPLYDESGEKVIGQKIVRGGLVMAEFTPPARGLGDGKLTVYTYCNLDAIDLELSCNQVADVKVLRLPILQEEKIATTAMLYDSDTEQPVTASDLIFRKDTDEVITKQYYVAIFDQYGDRLNDAAAQSIIPMWVINTPGAEKDTWVEYTELDEEGNPLPDEERFLRSRASDSAKTLTVVVDPSKYKGPLNLRVTCSLMTDDGDLLPITIPGFALTVRKRSSNTASSANGAYIVTYLAGAHGSLVGTISSETVLEGTTPKLVPDVVADEGYAHRGWDLDGELIDDPSTLEVYSDIVLVAQYIKLSDAAFVSGYEDNTVRPLSDITRGEFTRMLVGAVTNYDPETHAKYANPFDDVGENRYYRDYIAYAYFYGIVSGYEDGTFRPEEPITRAEAAGMIAKAKNIDKAVGLTVFKDLDPEGWYAGYVEALGRMEILHGYGDGTFRPANHLTRAEAVTMLVRISAAAPSEREIEAIRRNAEIPFEDLDRKYWAMPYILRAAGVA